MSIFSKRSVITLACVTAVGALTATPSLAGVVTPTDKTAVSTASPIDSVYYRYGGCHHRYYHRHYYRVGWGYPYYGWGGYPYWGYPYGAAAVGATVGAGLLGLGLGIL
jgi:hypothetical protein